MNQSRPEFDFPPASHSASAELKLVSDRFTGDVAPGAVIGTRLPDGTERKGIDVDARSLARDLGVPAVPTVAQVIAGEIRTAPMRARLHPQLETAVQDLASMIEQEWPGLPNTRWIAFRLLDGDHRIRQALASGEIADLVRQQAGPAERPSALISLQGQQ